MVFVLGRGDLDKSSDFFLGFYGKRIVLAWSLGCLVEWREGELEDLGVDFRSFEGFIFVVLFEVFFIGGYSFLLVFLS